jgi:hypothetical protein
MLRKVGRKRARVPLTREGVNSTLPHADGLVGMDEVCGLAPFQRCVGYRVFLSWLSLLASRISPAIVRVSSLTTMQCGVYLAVSSCKVRIKIPPTDSRSTEGGRFAFGMNNKLQLFRLTTSTCRVQSYVKIHVPARGISFI